MTRKTCSECSAPRAADQRYCIACGARLGSLPAAIAAQLGRARKLATGRFPAVKARAASAAASAVAKPGKPGWPFERSEFMPSPRAAAAAVIGMLALGVALGSATNNLAQSAGLSTILLEEPEPPAREAAAPAAAPAAPEVAETGGEPAPPAAPAAVPPPEAVVEEPLPGEPEPALPPIEEELPAGLPEIKHVFVIMLGEGGYEETFGEASASTYMSSELPALGELVPNYFAVTRGDLANQIALISGQGPTPETEADCPNYADLAPGTENAEGQVEGDGCVYPAATATLPGQLEERKLTWRAYVDEESPPEGSAPPPPASGCYVNRRDPFAYFHALLDAGKCPEADAGLGRLAKDLTLKAEKFPALAYIAPDPALAEETLRTIVPDIQESFAYKDGGLVVITSAEAPQGGEVSDTSACCVFPEYPNLVAEPEEEQPSGEVREKGGGGKVGAVLLSPYIEPGSTSEANFNHYSLLVTIEEFFGLTRIGYGAEPLVVGFDEEMFATSG